MDSKNFDLPLITNPPAELLIETSSLKTVVENCRDALEYNRMIAIIGDPGFGKTKSLDYFKSNNSNVYYIAVEKSMTARQFHIELMKCLGFTNLLGGSNLNTLIKSITFHLNQSKKRNLIIIDEAGKFTANQLLYLHEIRDNTTRNTGIVLSGPPYFKKNLESWKFSERQGIPELYRRIQSWIFLNPPTFKEKMTICNENGILEDLAKEICEDSTDFGILDNKILECRIAIRKLIKLK